MPTNRSGYFAEYRAAHRDEIVEYQRKYYATHRDEISECQRKYYSENKEQFKKYRETFQERNPAYQKEYNKTHHEKNKVQCQNNQRKLRFAALSAYSSEGTPTCACCGEYYLEFLAIDHINGDGAEHRKEIGTGSGRLYYWLRDHDYPEGFRVLCHNCNQALGHYGYCPHEKGVETSK